MSEHICPQCKCEKVSAVYYSCPAQADCENCGHRYEFGEGIRVIGLAEGMKLRPSMYEGYICEKCSGYTGPIRDFEELCDEDKEAVCTCK